MAQRVGLHARGRGRVRGMNRGAPSSGFASLAWEAKLVGFVAGCVLIGVVVGHSDSWWEWYGANRDKVIPLLAPLATVFGALATLAVGAFVVRAALEQASVARLRHEAQTRADFQRRITESYAKAVEQLGSDKIEVRLGGIYTLERISRESPDDYWTVMEILCAFVRERARWKAADAGSVETVARFYEKPAASGGKLVRPATDIAAVLAVIVRRDENNRWRERENGWWLDFSGADLRGADLTGANFDEADFSDAHLEKANFVSAQINGTIFTNTHLEMAKFVIANADRANFDSAYLDGVDLSFTFDLSFEQFVNATGNVETYLPYGMTRPAHWPPEKPRTRRNSRGNAA